RRLRGLCAARNPSLPAGGRRPARLAGCEPNRPLRITSVLPVPADSGATRHPRNHRTIRNEVQLRRTRADCRLALLVRRYETDEVRFDIGAPPGRFTLVVREQRVPVITPGVPGPRQVPDAMGVGPVHQVDGHRITVWRRPSRCRIRLSAPARTPPAV